MEHTKYLIVGSSHAALEAVTAIRMHDADGSLTLLTRDPHLPYSPTVLPYVVSGRSAPCTPGATLRNWPTAARSPTRRSCSPPAPRRRFRRSPASIRSPTMCCVHWTTRRG
jgi:hypothetical protein